MQHLILSEARAHINEENNNICCIGEGRAFLVQQFYEALNALPSEQPLFKNVIMMQYLEKIKLKPSSKLLEILEHDDDSIITIKIMYIILECIKSNSSRMIDQFLPFFKYVIELDSELFNNLLILKQFVHGDNSSTTTSTSICTSSSTSSLPTSSRDCCNEFRKMSFTHEIPEWKLVTFILFSTVCKMSFGNDFLEKATEPDHLLQNIPLFQMVLLEYFKCKKLKHLSRYGDCYWINNVEYSILGQLLEFFTRYLSWIDSIDTDLDEYISHLQTEEKRITKLLMEKLLIEAYEFSEVFDMKFSKVHGSDVKLLAHTGTRLISTMCSSYFESVQTVLKCLGDDYLQIHDRNNAELVVVISSSNHHAKTVGLIKQKIINISGSLVQSLFFSNLMDPLFNTRQIVETVLGSFVDPYLKLLLIELQKEVETAEDVLIKETACRSAGYYSAIFGKLLYQVSINLNNQFGEYLEPIRFLKNFNHEIIDIMVLNLKDDNLSVRHTTCISLSNFLSSREIRPFVFNQIVECFKNNLENFVSFSNLITVIVKFLHRDNVKDDTTTKITNTYLEKLCSFITKNTTLSLVDFKEKKTITTCIYYLGHDISIKNLNDFISYLQLRVRYFVKNKKMSLVVKFLPLLCAFLKTAHKKTIQIFQDLDFFKDLNSLISVLSNHKEFHAWFFKLIDALCMANIFKHLNLCQLASQPPLLGSTEPTVVVVDNDTVQSFIVPFLSNYIADKVKLIQEDNSNVDALESCSPCMVALGRVVEYLVIEMTTTTGDGGDGVGGEWVSQWAKQTVQTIQCLLENGPTDCGRGPKNSKINLTVETVRVLILLSNICLHEVATLFLDHVDDFFMFEDVPDRLDCTIIEYGFVQVLEYCIDYLPMDSFMENHLDIPLRIDDYLFGEGFSKRSSVLLGHWRRVLEKLKCIL